MGMSTVIDGSASVTINSGAVLGITSGTAVASTSGTSIDFTGIPSWVKRITVMLNGVITSGTSIPLVQIGDAGGIENTGYLGSSSWIRNAASPVTATSTAGMGLQANPLATDVLHGQAVITSMGSNTWSMTFNGSLSSTVITINSASSKTLSDTLTQVRITTTNGTDTFDAGTINILYE